MASQIERGKALRHEVPRSAHAELGLADDRAPLRIIETQHATRLSELVPVRMRRMLESPFAYYRGTAAVMAADLIGSVDIGLSVVACGDAHISNFGFYASPERSLLFDLNDFDEAAVAPWEWDLKRLTASIYVGARHIGMSEDAASEAVVLASQNYREALSELAQLSAVERYYATVDSTKVEEMMGSAAKRARKAESKARTRTSERVLERLTTRREDGELRIVDQPPIATHVNHASFEELTALYEQYRATARQDTAYLLGQFSLVDYILRVVGVGSVGTRCYLLAFEGESGEVLFLQAKEAGYSVLETFGQRKEAIPGGELAGEVSHGRRVVSTQRILQSHSDPFLGWITGFAGDQAERSRVDYYWRQFRDMKGSIDPATLNANELPVYGALCARLLARAHSQSPGCRMTDAYLGKGGPFDEAIASWSRAYADVNEADYEALAKAVDVGRFPISDELV